MAPPRRDLGVVYRAGQVPARGEETVGFETPTWFINQPQIQPARHPNWLVGLAVLGAIGLVLALCAFGLFLLDQTICPCTFGGTP